MAVNAITSNNVPAAAAAPNPATRIDKPIEKSVEPAPQAVAPSVNTSGQTTGTTISTSA